MYGLESIIDATDLEKQQMWLTLKGNENRNPVSAQLHTLMMRARLNSQRHYEIYSITTSPSISKTDIIQQFQDNPQGMAELIRERGNKIYSDRRETNDIKIT